MNPKENALRIIKFDNPERVVSSAPAYAIKYHGCDHAGYEGGGHHMPVGSRWTDIWGTTWHREHDGVMGFPEGNPLADLVPALKTYEWPDPNDERICKRIYDLHAEAENLDEQFLTGRHRDTLWEKSYMLVGMENMMCFLYTEPEAAREVFHRIMDFQLGIAKHYLKLGVDMVGMGDDLGTQAGLLFSPEILNDFLVPEYRRLFDLYKQHDVLIGFHSCGHVIPVLETFMELGADVLNPIQVTANDLDEFRSITRGRMALAGGINSDTIVHGPPAKIRAEVAARLWQLGREGGYFCGPDQGMPWPEEHIQTLHKAVEELGTYPLKAPEES